MYIKVCQVGVHIIRNAGIIRGRALYEEIRYMISALASVFDLVKSNIVLHSLQQKEYPLGLMVWSKTLRPISQV